MILLLLFIVCASANEDVEILVDGVWRLQSVPKTTTAAGEIRPGMKFAKITNDNTKRCPAGVTYVERCGECAECPECEGFNPQTCKCDRQFRCRPAASPSNPTSQPPIPSDALFDDPEAFIAKAPTTLVPTSTVNIQERPTTVTTTSTKAPSTLVPTTTVTTSKSPTTTTTTSTKAPTSLVSTTIVTTSHIPTKTSTTSEVYNTLVITTQTPTTTSPITLVPTNTFNISEISTTRTTISEVPITQAVTPKAPTTISLKTSDADPWLHSGKCGPHYPLPDGHPGQCNPKGEHPCCNPNSGWCGNTKWHCNCKGCIDYGDPWLEGGRCGPQFLLPSGLPSQCNPQGEHSCCNPNSGWCGNTKGHCACRGCIDYRETRSSRTEPMQDLSTPSTKPFDTDPWLQGGRCGPQHLHSDGRVSQCNPKGEYPCCNSNSGWCGNTKMHCACKNCIDYRNLSSETS